MFTLRDIGQIDDKIKNLGEPKSLTEVVERKLLKESLEDTGITNFKEIKNINNISFGHFIILEKILGYEIPSEKKVEMTSQYLLRPLNEDLLDNSDAEKERAHIDNVYRESIGNIYGVFNRYLKIRNEYLYKTYNGVIYAALDESESDEEKSEGTNIDSSQSARQFHSKKFFWNSMISTLANGDIFSFDKVVDLRMSVVMPYLAEKRSLEIVEYLEHKASRI